jgi:hypothetical protein
MITDRCHKPYKRDTGGGGGSSSGCGSGSCYGCDGLTVAAAAVRRTQEKCIRI